MKQKQLKDGTPRFPAYGQRNGKRVYLGTFDSRKAAEAEKRAHAVKQQMIADGDLAPEADTKRTFGESVATWLAVLKANKSRSHDAYSYRMEQYVLPLVLEEGKRPLGELPLTRVNKSVVGQLRDELVKHYAGNGVNGILVAVSSAFSYFVERGWVDANPCSKMKYAKVIERQYQWIESAEEITRVLLQCSASIRDIVTVALGTGMRLDEILHLQWTDINLTRRLIHVHRGRQGTTKSGKGRFIPILDTLLPFLSQLALKRDGATMVFPGQRQRGRSWSPTKPRNKSGVTRPFKAAIRRAGLSPKLRFHDLRHTFASHWVLDGGDIFRLSKLLGHASVAVTQKVYAHLSPDAWEQDYHRVAFVVPSEAPLTFLRGRPAEIAQTAGAVGRKVAS